jgi:hypothetical protein
VAYSTAFDGDGTARITHTILVPNTISPEARALMVRSGAPDASKRDQGRFEFVEDMRAV